jgi:hypothetical protein
VKKKKLVLRVRGDSIRDKKLEVIAITVFGKDEPNLAEKLKSQIILDALRGRNALLSNLHIEEEVRPEYAQSRDIAKVIWQGTPLGFLDNTLHPGLEYFSYGMNEGQKEALRVMLGFVSGDSSSKVQLPVVVGPPGSGKTTVISAFARAMAHFNQPVWLVSQSNVAVKNIAERLMRDDFMGWRLLISRDFVEGWSVDLSITPLVL